MQAMLYLTISIGDMITGDDKIAIDEFNCYVFLNNEPVYKLILRDNNSVAIIPINNLEDKIEFIFKKKDKPEIFGCVSITTKIFLPFVGQKISQWITLFDSPDDDEFDGELGISDEESPKVFANFQIDPGNVSSCQDQESIRMKPPTQEREPQKMDSFSMTSEKHETSFNDRKRSKARANEDRDSWATGNVLSPPQGNMLGEINQALSMDSDCNKSGVNSSNVQYRINAQSLCGMNINFMGEDPNNTSNEKIQKIVKNINRDASPTNSSLGNKPMEELKYSEYDVRKIMSEYEEKLKTLISENQKMRELETENGFLKSKIEENSIKYDESQQKIKLQFKQLFERSKGLNEENYTLKQRISELEKELILMKENMTEELKLANQNAFQQTDINKANLECYNLTIQNLEKLCQGYKEQYEAWEKAYKAEADKNKKILDSQTELLTNYKKIVEDSNSLQLNLENKLKQVEEERIALEKALQTRTTEIEGLTLRLSTYELDNASLVNAQTHFKEEIELHKKNYNTLKSGLDDILKEKNNEIGLLRDSLNKANAKINDIYSEYGRLQREKDYVQNEYNRNVMLKDYPSEILNLEKRIEVLQNSNRTFEDQLNESNKKYETMLKSINENKNYYPMNVDQELIMNLENKIKQLIEQFQVQSSECDKLKYENMNLQIKNNELQQLTDQFEELKSSHVDSLKRSHHQQELQNRTSHNEIKKSLGNNSYHHSRQGNITDALQNPLRVEPNPQRLELNPQRGESSLQKVETNPQRIEPNPQRVEPSQQRIDPSTGLSIMESSIEKQKGHKEASGLQQNACELPFEPYIPKKGDEIDQNLAEFINKNRVPIKFTRIAEGIYQFGTKKINMKILSGKLVVRIGGGFMMLEDFIKLFSGQEIIKLGMMKNPQGSLSDVELEDLPQEARSKIIKEETKEPEPTKNHEMRSGLTINSNSTSCLWSKISPNKTSVSRLSPLKKNITGERLSYNSNQRVESDRNIGLIRNESATQKISLPEDPNNIQEISPLVPQGLKKKGKSGKEISEKAKAGIGNDLAPSYGSNSGIQRSPMEKEKDRLHPKATNHMSRKDVSPLMKRPGMTK